MAEFIDYTIPLQAEDTDTAARIPARRPNIRGWDHQNRSVGFRLGVVKSYAYGLSNPALRPVVPKGV